MYLYPKTGHEGPERALDGGGWSTPRPGLFTPGKEIQRSLYRRLGGPQGRSGRGRKTSTSPGFDPRAVHSVASYSTDCAILLLFDVQK
jgi:hypothetical protein